MSTETTTENVQYSKTRLNLILAALVVYSIVQGFGLFKLIPMQDAIMNYFQIGEGAYGYLTTANNWLLIVATVPMGFIMRKYSCRWTFPIGYLMATAGLVIQLLTHNYVLFVIGRVLEGGGIGFVTLAAHSLILNLVPDNRKGLWASILVVAATLPQVAISKGGTALMTATGMSFKTIFAIIGIMYLVAIAFWVIVTPSSLMAHGTASAQKATKEQTRRVYKNPAVWLISIAFVFYILVSTTFSVYVIRFLMLKGMERGAAATAHSWTTILGIFAMLFSGILADKLGTKRKIVIVSYLACTAALILLPLLPVNLIYIYVIIYGTFPRAIVGLTNVATGELTEVPSDVPIAQSLKNTIMQVGTVLGGIGMGYLIQYTSYSFTSYVLAGGCFLGAICWILAKKIK